jgi:GT2 family glycosyltransferase
MGVTPIYITSFHRKDFTERCVREIHERTAPGTYEIHLYDNDSMSDKGDRDFAYGLLEKNLITSLHLDARNTGCLYNKMVFHAMTTADTPFYVVTDNDVFPPKLEPDWLSRMLAIMNGNPSLALLAMQLPPQIFQRPSGERALGVWYCRAVGNTFKVVRTEALSAAMSQGLLKQALMKFGDDGAVSTALIAMKYRVGFCQDIYCYHAGQCDKWGYRQEELAKDPRKIGYGKPFTYAFEDEEKYLPEKKWRLGP